MTTPTSILHTISPSARFSRNQAERCLPQLIHLQQSSDDFTVRLIAQGVLWADDTGRTTGTVSMALRRATGWQAAQLVAAMLRDGLDLPAPVPAWLNANALRILGC
jgi:hypothetical protein